MEDLFGQVAGLFAKRLPFVKVHLIAYIEKLLQLFFGANHKAHAFPYLVGEVVEISDRLLVIHQGKLLLDEQVAELAERARKDGRTLEEHILGVVRSAEDQSKESMIS